MPAHAAPQYPTREVPVPGASVEIAPGVWWLRMALPFALNHINVWLLEDGDGWTVVDTGLSNESTRAHWDQALAARLGGRPVRRGPPGAGGPPGGPGGPPR